MIVIDEPPASLLIISQPDHAATSGEIARAWCRPDRFAPVMWERFIEAVRRHDDGWIDTELRPSLDSEGRPHDFKSIHTGDHVLHWRRGIDRAADDELYIGLVVALHARWLYTHVEQGSVEEQRLAHKFVSYLTTRIDAMIRHLASGTEEAAAVAPNNLFTAQRLLSFFDAISLMLLGGIGWMNQTEPLRFGGATSCLTLTLRKDGPCNRHVHVDPWPLRSPSLAISTKGRRLNRQQFENPDQFDRLLKAAPQIRLRWELLPGQARDPTPLI